VEIGGSLELLAVEVLYFAPRQGIPAHHEPLRAPVSVDLEAAVELAGVVTPVGVEFLEWKRLASLDFT